MSIDNHYALKQSYVSIKVISYFAEGTFAIFKNLNVELICRGQKRFWLHCSKSESSGSEFDVHQ